MNALTPNRMLTRRGFTLVEIMIVVGIIGIVIAIAGPGWVRQRNLSQWRVCQENLTKIDGAKEQWAMAEHRDVDAKPTWDDLVDVGGYLKKQPVCPGDGTYTINTINVDATCSINEPFDHNANQDVGD